MEKWTMMAGKAQERDLVSLLQRKYIINKIKNFFLSLRIQVKKCLESQTEP